MTDSITDAWLDGWHAHRNGALIDGDSNPYSEWWQKRSHYQWRDGWCARFAAIKHGGSLEHDDL